MKKYLLLSVLLSQSLLASEIIVKKADYSISIGDRVKAAPYISLSLDHERRLQIDHCQSNGACEKVGDDFLLEDYQGALELMPKSFDRVAGKGTLTGAALGAAPILICVIRPSKCGPLVQKLVPNKAIRNTVVPFMMVNGNVAVGGATGYGVDYLTTPSETTYKHRDHDSIFELLEQDESQEIEVGSLRKFLGEISNLQMTILNTSE